MSAKDGANVTVSQKTTDQCLLVREKIIETPKRKNLLVFLGRLSSATLKKSSVLLTRGKDPSHKSLVCCLLHFVCGLFCSAQPALQIPHDDANPFFLFANPFD